MYRSLSTAEFVDVTVKHNKQHLNKINHTGICKDVSFKRTCKLISSVLRKRKLSTAFRYLMTVWNWGIKISWEVNWSSE